MTIDSGNNPQNPKDPSSLQPCAETGTWTAIPYMVPSSQTLELSSVVSTSVYNALVAAGKMTFHMVGCSGDPSDPTAGLAVGNAMASQIAGPGNNGFPNGPATGASFFFHLGDMTYTSKGSADTAEAVQEKGPEAASKTDRGALWNTQFYAQYTNYVYPNNGGPTPIFGIAGNHDGKNEKGKDDTTTEIYHYWNNFCGGTSDNQTGDGRKSMIQPYIYWTLDTPYATLIGLYTNVCNSGVLDDPATYTSDFQQGPQYQWLVQQLKNAGQARQDSSKAILLALHYPPYSAAANFVIRGDPSQGTGGYKTPPIGNVLQQAFTDSGQIPDAIFSAHAHLYQRLTLNLPVSGNHTWQVPLLVVGCGGHTPIENLLSECDGKSLAALPWNSNHIFEIQPAVVPASLSASNPVVIEQFGDSSYGFLRVTLVGGKSSPILVGEYFTVNAVSPLVPTLSDAFLLDLATHALIPPAGAA